MRKFTCYNCWGGGTIFRYTFETCNVCRGSGLINANRYYRYNKKRRRDASFFDPYGERIILKRVCYRVQVATATWNDWDVISCVEWKDEKLFFSKEAATRYLGRKLLECEGADYTPYRLVDPQGFIITQDGEATNEPAYSSYTFNSL